MKPITARPLCQSFVSVCYTVCMSHYKKNCVFCKVAQRKIEHSQFWEDDSHIAFLDKDQSTFGHTLVIPKNHVSYVFNLHEKEYLALLLRAEKIAKALQKLTKCKRVALSIYGFEVPHTHIHLLPLNTLPTTGRKTKRPKKQDVRKLVGRLTGLFA